MERGDDYDLWQRGVSSVGRPTWCFQLLLCLTSLLLCCEEEEDDDETRRGAVSGRNGSGGLSEGGSQAQHLRRRMILGF